MATVRIEGITLRRGGASMLDDVTLDVADGEVLVILGASGAGKSSLLRVVAGLETPDSGRVWIGGSDVTGVPTSDRRIAMMFQENTLYPFMDVRHNVSFPLEMSRASKEEVEARVLAETRVLAIEHLLDRMPGQLSAGHQQLVQAARALVRVPDVFLMDEPLARLDAHLRVVMRREFRLLQSGYGVTTMYVTNEPDEAMAMADRIVILDRGRVEQVGTPLAVYGRPTSRVAASLLGTRPMVFVPGRVVADPPGFWVDVGPLRLRAWDPSLANAPGSVDVGLRPEEVEADLDGVPGIVVESEVLGAWTYAMIEVAGDLVIPMRSESPLAAGDRVHVRLVGAHVFSCHDGRAIGHVPFAVG